MPFFFRNLLRRALYVFLYFYLYFFRLILLNITCPFLAHTRPPSISPFFTPFLLTLYYYPVASFYFFSSPSLNCYLPSSKPFFHFPSPYLLRHFLLFIFTFIPFSLFLFRSATLSSFLSSSLLPAREFARLKLDKIFMNSKEYCANAFSYTGMLSCVSVCVSISNHMSMYTYIQTQAHKYNEKIYTQTFLNRTVWPQQRCSL